MWNLCHYGWPDGLRSALARLRGPVCPLLRRRGPLHLATTATGFILRRRSTRSRSSHGPPERRAYFHPHRDDAADPDEASAGAGVHRRHRSDLGGGSAGPHPADVDPIIHVVTPRGQTRAGARRSRSAGRHSSRPGTCSPAPWSPQLGGHPRYLDVIGVNFYHANQWEYPDQRLRWEDTPRDPRWMPFSALLAEMYFR